MASTAIAHSHADNNDHLITSSDPQHPANLICELCRGFYKHGWVTGTGGGTSIRDKYVQCLEAGRSADSS